VPSTDASPLSLSAPQLAPAPAEGQWLVQPLQGWHLNHLDDPALQPLLPLLQRSILLALPERLLRSLDAPAPRGHRVFVAVPPTGSGPLLGLIVTRPQNRRRTCWRVCHLRLALSDGGRGGRLDLAVDLLRHAIAAGSGAASWVAHASSLDITRLAALREMGFQPQLRESLWCWQPRSADGRDSGELPPDLQLQPISPRNQRLLWHLEQASTPAPLRQLLDRGIDDVRPRAGGLLLVDRGRDQAVASLRCSGPHPSGGSEVDLRLRPGWDHLYGPATGLLLRSLHAPEPLWLRSELADHGRLSWLELIGAERHGEEVLMARSVWRRQPHRAGLLPARRLEAVIAQLQPGRRPLPSPSGTPW